MTDKPLDRAVSQVNSLVAELAEVTADRNRLSHEVDRLRVLVTRYFLADEFGFHAFIREALGDEEYAKLLARNTREEDR